MRNIPTTTMTAHRVFIPEGLSGSKWSGYCRRTLYIKGNSIAILQAGNWLTIEQVETDEIEQGKRVIEWRATGYLRGGAKRG